MAKKHKNKRSVIVANPPSGGSCLTSPRRARELVRRGMAIRLSGEPAAIFLLPPASARQESLEEEERAILCFRGPKIRWEWKPGISGKFTVMKARARGEWKSSEGSSSSSRGTSAGS